MRSVRSKWLNVTKHALQGMEQERPPVSLRDIESAFEDPHYDDSKEVRKRIGRRTVRVYYTEYEDEIEVRGVSRTTGG